MLLGTDDPAGPTSEDTPRASSRRGIRRWSGWIQAVVIFAAYQTFETVRALVQGRPGPSFHHASQVIRVEQMLGIFTEARIQSWLLPHHLIVEFWDLWYGTVHFVVPPLTLVLLYHRCPGRYRHHRDALVALSLLGLLCFWLWPLAPPRLLPLHYHFADTSRTIGGMGAADRGSMADDNAFAAMPSLHIGWSTWCAVVLVPILRSWWTKLLSAVYPMVTLAAVVITANHFFLDGAGGVFTLAAGWAVATAVDRGVRRRGHPGALLHRAIPDRSSRH